MKVLLINGSPNDRGCTHTALSKVADGLDKFDIEHDIVWLGKDLLKPCVVCMGCKGKAHRCLYGDDDGVNYLIDRINEVDALVLGSPVHYAGISGQLKTIFDRVFFASGSQFAHKLGAGIVSARRAGTTAALEQLNKYFLISQMPIVASYYWPMVHGSKAEDVLKDEEGCQVAEQLGANMGWLLTCIEAGKEAGISPYVPDTYAMTNFIR